MRLHKKGFTLLELIIVGVIISILATLAFTHYGGFKEKTLDREAQSNLLLIAAGERIARMESNNNSYIVVGVADTNQINSQLRLVLPTSNPAWNYTIAAPASGSTIGFCAIATRSGGDGRKWYIVGPTTAKPDPQPQSGSSCLP